ncbi:hypothetical protein GUJ93_ZPchr0009g2445 [Zizania palustris]|uniref:Uncharacterized protein n=1 Tax=Zizania palustris TaxID=103762 RepID=A0A8J5V3M5_ZIZPA|nr:hypothetical protein GUJ93_ZPchr0009g2445 [Zizania palustris]
MAGSAAPAAAPSGSDAGTTRFGAPVAANLPPAAADLPPAVAAGWQALGAPPGPANLPPAAVDLPPIVAAGWQALGAPPPLLVVGFPLLMARLGAAAAGPYLPIVPPPLAATPRAGSGLVLATACWPATTDVVDADAALAAALATAKTATAAAREREKATTLTWESARQAADALAQHVAEAERHLGVAVPPAPATVYPAVAADPGAAQLHT